MEGHPEEYCTSQLARMEPGIRRPCILKTVLVYGDEQTECQSNNITLGDSYSKIKGAVAVPAYGRLPALLPLQTP